MKKQTKGLVSLWLALAMVISLITPALAAPRKGTLLYTGIEELGLQDTVPGTVVENFDSTASLTGEAKRAGLADWQVGFLQGWKLWTGSFASGNCYINTALADYSETADVTKVVMDQTDYANITDDYLLLEPVYDPGSYSPVYIWTKEGGIEATDPVEDYLRYPSNVFYETPLSDQSWLADTADRDIFNPEGMTLKGWKLWDCGSGDSQPPFVKENLKLDGKLSSELENNINALILEPLFAPHYEITHQPTEAEPSVTVWDNKKGSAAEGVSYRWYKAMEYPLADKEVGGATIGVVETGEGTATYGTYDGNVWTSKLDPVENFHGFDQSFSAEAGDVITVKFLSGDDSGRQCMMMMEGDGPGDAKYLTKNGDEYIGTVETGGTCILGIFGDDQFTCSIKVTRTSPIEEQGQDTNTFEGFDEAMGTYVCKATVDGVTLTSEPLCHRHSADMACSTAEGDQVAFDRVLTTADGKLFINGAEQTTSRSGHYVLPVGNYVLGGDLNLNNDIRFEGESGGDSNIKATLCLNGHLIQGGAPNSRVLSGTNADLVVCDCDKDAEHTVTSAVDSTKQVEFTGGGIVGARKTSGTSDTVSWKLGDLKLYGGSIVGNQSDRNILSLDRGTLTLESVTITGNTSAGATVYLYSNSTATLKDGEIRGNHSTGYNGAQPGAIRVLSGNTLILSGNPHIEGNTVEGTDEKNTLTVEYDEYYAKDGIYSVSLDSDLVPSFTIPVRVAYEGHGLFTDATAKDRADAFTVETAGFFIEAQENGLATVALAITGEPTKENKYTVTPNDPDDVKSYQWYKVEETTGELTGEAVCEKAALTTATDGKYACKVTWDVDGVETTLTSEAVDYVHVHNIEKVDGKAPTCTEPGWPDYYKCECDTVANIVVYFEDAAGQTPIPDLDAWKTDKGKLPATGTHTPGAWITDETNHWKVCSVCKQKVDSGAHVYTGDQDATCNTCGYTRTLTPSEQPDPTYSIFGDVTVNGVPASGVKLTLKKGNTVFAETSTDGGAYHFADVAPGVYNIVATKDGKTMTVLVTVSAAGATEKNLTMPSGNVNSVLVVEQGALDVVVGGLEVEAQAAKAAAPKADAVTVTMTVKDKTRSTADHARQIENAAHGRSLEYMEIKVEKTVDAVTKPITTTGDLLTVVIPFQTESKYNMEVYRYHGSRVDTLSGEKNRNGEYIVLNDTDVTLYVKDFSTYAVGYTETEELPEVEKPSRPNTSSARPTDRDPAKEYDTCPKDATCPIAKFSDAKADAWYHDGVHYCLEKGLMIGTSDTTFEPETVTSRAMIATILWRLQGSKTVSDPIPYPDVADGTWYTEAVRWATKEGIVTGYDTGKFGPDDPITREQLATMLYRYEQKFGKGGFTGNWMFRLDFTDIDQIGEWAYEALCWMTMNDVITGKPGKVLDPKGQATRAEAAAMLQRYIQTASK